MKLILVFLLTVFVTPAFAIPWADLVVKVSSRADGSPKVYYGSGILFSHQNEAYVLISEHIGLHSNDGVKHQIKFNDGRVAQASYVTSDFAIGLALLKADIKDASEFPDLKSERWGEGQHGVPIINVGFPTGSQTQIMDAWGGLRGREEKPTILMKVKMLISDGHAEFGMSGGALVDDHTAKLIGVLSHVSSKEAGIVYSIPALEARKWLEEVFKEPGYKAEFCRLEPLPVERVFTGELRLRMSASTLEVDYRRVEEKPCGKLHKNRVFEQFQEFAAKKAAGSIYSYPVTRIKGFKQKGFLNVETNSRTFPGNLIQAIELLDADKLQPVVTVDIQGQNPTADLSHAHYALKDAYQNLVYACPLKTLLSSHIQMAIRISDHDPYTPKPGQLPLEFLRPVDIDHMINAAEFKTDWVTCGKKVPKATAQLKLELEELREIMRYFTI